MRGEVSSDEVNEALLGVGKRSSGRKLMDQDRHGVKVVVEFWCEAGGCGWTL